MLNGDPENVPFRQFIVESPWPVLFLIADDGPCIRNQ
jgi:hypothetical protein